MRNKKGDLINALGEFVAMDDIDFFERYIMQLSLEKQEKFMKENPEFLKGHFAAIEDLPLLQDKAYREMCRKTIRVLDQGDE